MSAMEAMAAAEMKRVHRAWDIGGGKPSRKGSLTAKRVVQNAMKRAADIYQIGEDEILSRGRTGFLVEARQSAMMFAHASGVSMEDIGMHMDRDHSTVSYGVKRAKERLDAVSTNLIFKSRRANP